MPSARRGRAARSRIWVRQRLKLMPVSWTNSRVRVRRLTPTARACASRLRGIGKQGVGHGAYAFVDGMRHIDGPSRQRVQQIQFDCLGPQSHVVGEVLGLR
ncbi:hypothetical protein HNR72_000145 [Streptomyces collinus]|uniref:Uncharacterized protein n=1 Tax=Streptomyces collinus TaxID=42684 RepID=A0AA89PT64_STRCU|nr:hypothetical protein [Streptomyces collinus]